LIVEERKIDPLVSRDADQTQADDDYPESREILQTPIAEN